MSLSSKLIEKLYEFHDFSQEDADVVAEFSKRINALGLEGISVSAVQDGNDFIVSLEDSDGDEEHIVFGVDEDGPYALIMSENDIDLVIEGEGNILDLDPLDPPLNADGSIQLSNLSWLTDAMFSTILLAGDIGPDEVEERMRTAVRGGKKVRIMVKHRKKRLSPRQKAAIAKAGRKKKGKKLKASTKRKRALSQKVRKRLKL